MSPGRPERTPRRPATPLPVSRTCPGAWHRDGSVTARGARGRSLPRGGRLLAVALLDRGEVLEVALDAGGELLALVAEQLELRLAPGPLALASRLRAEAACEPRPLGSDENRDGAGEQGDPQPAHRLILAGVGARSSVSEATRRGTSRGWRRRRGRHRGGAPGACSTVRSAPSTSGHGSSRTTTC